DTTHVEGARPPGRAPSTCVDRQLSTRRRSRGDAYLERACIGLGVVGLRDQLVSTHTTPCGYVDSGGRIVGVEAHQGAGIGFLDGGGELDHRHRAQRPAAVDLGHGRAHECLAPTCARTADTMASAAFGSPWSPYSVAGAAATPACDTGIVSTLPPVAVRDR